MGEQVNHSSSIFNKEFEGGLDDLCCNYGIECVYLGDAILEEIGACKVYIPLDLRTGQSKQEQCFDEYIFRYIDGTIIKGAQFNSVLLKRKEIEGLISGNGFRINWNAPNILKKPIEKGFLYETIAVNNPFADELSTFGCLLPEIGKYD